MQVNHLFPLSFFNDCLNFGHEVSGHFIFKEGNFIVFISQSFIEERNDSRCRTTKTPRACCTGNAIVNKSSDLNGFDIRSA